MATINGSTNNSNWGFRLEVSEDSTDINSNTSRVTVRVYIGRTTNASYMRGSSINFTVGITGCNNQGINYSNAGTLNFSAGQYRELGSTTFTVPHNNDGSKTVSISASFSNNVSPYNGSASGNLTLTNIPRQANITNSPTTFTDESNPWFSYENKANAPMSCWLEPNPNGEHLCGRTLSGTSGTYTWNLTEDERKQLRRKCAGKSCILRIGLYSTIGGNTYASYHDRTMTIVNGEPTFTDYTYQDINTKTLELTGNAKTIIKGYSKLQVSVSNENKAIANKESSMSYYKVDEVKGDYSATDTVGLVIDKYGKKTITCLAVDSRGYSKTVEKNIENFIDYVEIIKNSLSLTRSDNGVGEFVNLSFSGSFWNGNFGAINNDLTITYKYKKTTNTEYTEGTTTILPTITENTFSFDNLIAGDTEQKGFDINDSYDIEVIVEDKLNEVIYSGVIGAGIPAIAVYKNKVALGDKYDTSLGGIQLWGDVYINGKKIS